MNQNRKSGDQYMNDQEFDHLFKSQLEHQEVVPDASNWTKIKRWGPLGFWVSISSKKALSLVATLLFLLSATTLIFQFGYSTMPTPSVAEVVTSPVSSPVKEAIDSEEAIKATPSDFVLDLSSKEETSDIQKEIIDKELDEYLAFLLEDEDEFAHIIDSNEILKYLEPAQQLPFEEMFAVIPELPVQEEITILAPLETKITIPHRFVADGEQIEDFLLLYEINQLRN